MREPADRTIDGKLYTFYKFPVKEGLKTLFAIAKIIGEPLGLFAEGILKQKDLKGFLGKDTGEAVKELAIDKIINSLMTNLDEDKAITIIDTLLKNVHHKGTPASETMDVLFSDDYMHLAKVLKTALEVQYGNFFKGIIDLQKSGNPVSPQEK